MPKLLGIDDFKRRLIDRFGDTVILDESTYVNTKTKTRFIDKEYGEWWALPANVLRGIGHPKRSRDAQTFTPSQAKDKIEGIHRGTVVLDESTYINTRTKARFIDKEYGEWWATVNDTLQGHGHPLRGRNTVKTKVTLPASEIGLRIEKIHGDTLCMDESTYTNTRVKARFIDREYGEWWARPYSILQGHGHPLRAQEVTKARMTLSASEIKTKIEKVHGDFVTLDESTYVDTRTKARFIDKEYGEWWAKANDLLQGHGHPNRYNKNSHPQNRISEWIQSLGIHVESSSRIPNSRYEIDLFISDLGLGIEYHGLYWHSSAHKENDYHIKKRRLCEENGIRLLQFFADEVEFKLPIVQSIIQSHLKVNQTQIYARKCEIRLVASQTAQDFLRDNHLMGSYKPAQYIGLFYKAQLVSLLGYRKNKDSIEISRFCNLLNHIVPGGLSKLLKYIEKEVNPDQIISWVDLRYGNGTSLEKIGFRKAKETLGWRWTDYTNSYNRLKCRANMDDRKLTQKQHAEELRWVKIYDAGQGLFIKNTTHSPSAP